MKTPHPGVPENDGRKRPAVKAADAAAKGDPITDETLLLYLSGPEQSEVVRPRRAVKYEASAKLWVEGTTKYKIVDELAKGGMGVIYQAEDIKCSRIVALKVMSSDRERRKEDFNRFVGEARITSQLEHPNIVPVHELGNDSGGNVFYTMKFVHGESLAAVLKGIRDGDEDILADYPLSRLLTVFQKTCDAVAFAHSKGIIHRDLKPANIMIGDFGEVLVLDWGLAKGLEDSAMDRLDKIDSAEWARKIESAVAALHHEPLSADEHALLETLTVELIEFDTAKTELKTRAGTVMGTPGFLAPEQVRSGGARFDARTDIYALGAILYSILTLRPPVTGTDLREILRQVLMGGFPSPADITGSEAVGSKETHKGDSTERLPHCPRGRVPVVLSDVAMRALATEPELRFASVKEMQREIEDYQNGLVWHLVVDEDFSGPEVFDRWDIMGGKFQLLDGELRVWGGEPQIVILKQDLSGDVRIEFECRIEGNYLNDVACCMSVVRSNDPWTCSVNGYAFKYGAYTNSFNVITRNDQKIWSQAASPLVRGDRYNVRAERIGSQLRFFVNGEEVATVIDSNPLVGAHRTGLGLLGWVADVRYSRVRVYSLGAPWKSDVLESAERHLGKGHYITAMDLFQDVLDAFPDADRVRRAREGYENARNFHQWRGLLPEWQARMDRAWPGVGASVRIEKDGLRVDIPPNSGVRDLEPLRGIPLTTIHCVVNEIASLDPLAGMPLKVVNCSGNPITSLEPLRGAALQILLCERCRIASLDPLAGMPLDTLNCSGNNLANGVEPLRGMSPRWLDISQTNTGSLEPLRGMPLGLLFCSGNRISDLEPLRGMMLAELICSRNEITDLEPLRGMPLTNLNIGMNRIRSLAPLRGMPLSTLRCQANEIESLDPLADLPLNFLLCGANKLRNLGPLVKNPPKMIAFDCETISTKELEWLHQLWSRDFRFVEYAQQVEVLLALRARDAEKLKALAREFQGHRYLYVPRLLPWDEARVLSESLGGHLLCLASKEENEFVTSMFPYGGSWFWLGLRTTEQGHEWVTGEPVGFATFCHVLDERGLGPKLFAAGNWRQDMVPDAWNCFMIEWDD